MRGLLVLLLGLIESTARRVVRGLGGILLLLSLAQVLDELSTVELELLALLLVLLDGGRDGRRHLRIERLGEFVVPLGDAIGLLLDLNPRVVERAERRGDSDER